MSTPEREKLKREKLIPIKPNIKKIIEVQDKLFELTLGKKWGEVVDLCKKNDWVHGEKLTKSEDTPLHVAVSSYIPGRPRESLKLEKAIKDMINSIDKLQLFDVLSTQNLKGDTALHLAAALGWHRICYFIASKDSKDKQLISIRNVDGETPLFVAAHHCKLKAFLCLHELYKNNNGQQPDLSICRRSDGNTILHSAISGEYFELGYQIIKYYPELIDSVNVNGETPLHILARKPNAFQSSTKLGFYDSIIYNFARPEELKEMRYKHKDPVDVNQQKTVCVPTSGQYPPNYKTCVDVFVFIVDPFLKCISRLVKMISSREEGTREEERNRPTRTRTSDEENQERGENRPPSTSGENPGNRPMTSTSGEKNQERGENTPPRSNEYGFFPPNYKNFILLLESAMKVILIVLGLGYWRIESIQKKKKQHTHSLQIAYELIETCKTGYKYDSNGLQPIPKLTPTFGRIDLPDTPPDEDLPDTPPDKEQDKSKDQKENPPTKRDTALLEAAKRDTALLEAAKWGIPEIVGKILDKCPIAIQDLDSTGKNVLLVAAQNKQVSIFDSLSLKKKLPETLFHQVDNDGNSILHLAAERGELHPWRIPGDALQMQAEIKWFKYVKDQVPTMFIAHPNKKGDIPRKIFTESHDKLVKDATDWLRKTSESCSVIAALVATVAFSTSTAVPGGLDQESGYPIHKNTPAFDVFSITSLVALCLAVTSLVCFLAIMTSRCQEHNFERDLPTKILVGLTSLFASIVVSMVSFCAGHTFIFKEKLRGGAAPIYAIASIPIMLFAVAQLPLYFDLLRAICFKVPQRSYKVFHE